MRRLQHLVGCQKLFPIKLLTFSLTLFCYFSQSTPFVLSLPSLHTSRRSKSLSKATEPEGLSKFLLGKTSGRENKKGGRAEKTKREVIGGEVER